jgi:hypothetical protein
LIVCGLLEEDRCSEIQLGGKRMKRRRPIQNASMDGFECDLTKQNQLRELCVGGRWMFKSRRRCRDPLCPQSVTPATLCEYGGAWNILANSNEYPPCSRNIAADALARRNSPSRSRPNSRLSPTVSTADSEFGLSKLTFRWRIAVKPLGEDFNWMFKIKCTSCREEHPNWVGIDATVRQPRSSFQRATR